MYLWMMIPYASGTRENSVLAFLTLEASIRITAMDELMLTLDISVLGPQ